MERKEVEIGSPVSIGEISLVPVAELSLNYRGGKRCSSFFGIKQPVCIVVVSPSGKRAFRASGEEVPLEQLIQEVPALRETLAAI